MATNSYKGQSNRISEDALPDDVRDGLSATFSPDVIYALVRDAYYRGPVRVGTGGERDAWGGSGKVGSGLRRPDAALYDYPESWRNSVLRKALDLDLLEIYAGDEDDLDASENRYVPTSRGLDLFLDADRCEECGRVNRPVLHNAGSSHRLTTLSTACPVHDSGGADYERRDDDLERARAAAEEGVPVYVNEDDELRARDPDGLRSDLRYGDRVEISGGRNDGATAVVLDGLDRDALPDEFANSMGPVNSVYSEEGVVVLMEGEEQRLTGSARALDRTELRLVEESYVEEVPVFSVGAKVRTSPDSLTREVVEVLDDDYYRVRYPSSNPYSEGEQSTALYHALELEISTRPLDVPEPEFEEGDEVRFLRERDREDHNLGTPARVARVVVEDYDEEKGHYYVLDEAETGDYLSGAYARDLLDEEDARDRDPDGEPFEEGDEVHVEDEEGVYRVFDDPTPNVSENTYIYSVVPEGSSTKSELSARSRFPRNRRHVRHGELSAVEDEE